MLLHDWSHHTEVLWSSSSGRGSLWCTHLHHENRFVQLVIVFFPLSSSLILLFISSSAGVSRKAIPVHLVYSSCFYRSCSFSFVALYVLYWLFCVLCCACLFSTSGLSPILLISARILVPLISLRRISIRLKLWFKINRFIAFIFLYVSNDQHTLSNTSTILKKKDPNSETSQTWSENRRSTYTM